MSHIKVALIGNPNVGKSSIFNKITGLNQKIGNYPGITVDKKFGYFTTNNIHYKLYDLPGTYSIFPASNDEQIVFNLLADTKNVDHPNAIILVLDATQIKRGLLFYQQVKELNMPIVLVLNMIDEAKKKGITINIPALAIELGTEIIVSNARTGEGLDLLKKSIPTTSSTVDKKWFQIPAIHTKIVQEVYDKFNLNNHYLAWQYLAQKNVSFLNEGQNIWLKNIKDEHKIIYKRLQVTETIAKYKVIDEILKKNVFEKKTNTAAYSEKIDQVVTHPILGYLIFFGLLFLIFESIFKFSEYPMNFIENIFGLFSNILKDSLPSGPLLSLLTDGLIPGIAGIVIFVPQITILFFFLLLMEESGYMSRVVFLMDKWVRPFGLSGKSVIPLISGTACAIPAIMSTRNIENTKDRLITILVTPFMTCSARLPVYTIIIGLVIPLHYKGLALMLMYLVGLVAALLSAYILKKIIKTEHKSFLILEMPSYKMPLWSNVSLSLWQNISAFVFDAGKIILSVSVILWVLAFFGPEKSIFTTNNEPLKLEKSYLGILGKTIEPTISPLGYDWKIGVGIISSFAAREVFVPTMATIYSLEYQNDDTKKDEKLIDKMRSETNIETHKKTYTFATGFSLLMFYALAMQCTSTLAVVKKETKSWRWPMIQLVVMTVFAYLVSFIIFQLFK